MCKQSSKVDARLIESFNIPFSGLSDGLLLIIAFDQCLEPDPEPETRETVGTKFGVRNFPAITVVTRQR